MINIVYSYLRTEKSNEEWVCEVMYYLDQLLAIAKNVDPAICNGYGSKGKNSNVMSPKHLTSEDRKKLIQVIFNDNCIAQYCFNKSIFLRSFVRKY